MTSYPLVEGTFKYKHRLSKNIGRKLLSLNIRGFKVSSYFYIYYLSPKTLPPFTTSLA
jgi:hypothetical protein